MHNVMCFTMKTDIWTMSMCNTQRVDFCTFQKHQSFCKIFRKLIKIVETGEFIERNHSFYPNKVNGLMKQPFCILNLGSIERTLRIYKNMHFVESNRGA